MASTALIGCQSVVGTLNTLDDIFVSVIEAGAVLDRCLASLAHEEEVDGHVLIAATIEDERDHVKYSVSRALDEASR